LQLGETVALKHADERDNEGINFDRSFFRQAKPQIVMLHPPAKFPLMFHHQNGRNHAFFEK
jgi:hypothetical protein